MPAGRSWEEGSVPSGSAKFLLLHFDYLCYFVFQDFILFFPLLN